MSDEAGAPPSATKEAPKEDGAPKAEEPKGKKGEKKKHVPILPKLDPELMVSTRLYELCLLFEPGEAARTWDKLVEWIKELIGDKFKQHVLKVDKWADSRKLAYEIKGLRRGTYMVVWFRADPLSISDLDRDLRLDERSARHIIVQHEEEPPTVGKTSEDFEAGRERSGPPGRGFGGRRDFGGGGGGRRDYGGPRRDRDGPPPRRDYDRPRRD